MSGHGLEVHDLVAHFEELLGPERLREEVREVVLSGDVWHHELEVLDALADEEVAALDVLHAVVVLRVVRDVARALAVGRELRRPHASLTLGAHP